MSVADFFFLFFKRPTNSTVTDEPTCSSPLLVQELLGSVCWTGLWLASPSNPIGSEVLLIDMAWLFFLSLQTTPPIQPSRMNEVVRGHCSFGNCSALYAGRNYGSLVLLVGLGRNLCQSICTWFSLGASYHYEPSHELIPWNRGILLKLCIRLTSYVMEVNETFQLRVG